VEIPVSCQQGICGSCITRVLEGKADHRDQVLSDKERDEENWFTPCCSRALTPRLVLDI
jgi:vanillate O-demethylase ferredoxin subunit